MSCPEQKRKVGKFPILPLEDVAWATSSILGGGGGKTNEITTLRRADVVLGRGRAISNWDGNVGFRKIVAEHRREYKLARTGEKALIGKRVMKRVFDRGGRFVQTIANKMGGKGETSLFVVVPRSKALEKTCQLLREKKFTVPAPGPPGPGSTSNDRFVPDQKRKRTARIKIKAVDTPSFSSATEVTPALRNNEVLRGKGRKHKNKKSSVIGSPTRPAKTKTPPRSQYSAGKDVAAGETVAPSLVASSPEAALLDPASSSSIAASFLAKRHAEATVASPVGKTEPALFSTNQGIEIKNATEESPGSGKVFLANDVAKDDPVADPHEDYDNIDDDKIHRLSTTFDPYTEASMFLRRLDGLLRDSESVAGNEFFEDWAHLARRAASPEAAAAADQDRNDA